MSITKDRLQEIFDHVAAECRLKNWHYKMAGNSENIETYFGVVIPVTIIGDYDDKRRSQNVYVKLPTVDESITAFSGYLWDTEVYFYSSFVPVWRSMPNVNIDELIPKCYYANATPNKQTLVLQNMKCKGFEKYKGQFLDFEHVTVSLRSLAQFHALSFVIKKNREDLMSSLLRPYTDVYPPELNKTMLNTFRAHFKLFKSSKYEHYWDETLANYKTVVVDSTSKAKCFVYGHGDYCIENIMYKYEGNKPVHACILDFQCCRLMTPAYDFLYFILNSTNGGLRKLHYHHFVTEYYSTFKNALLDHGVQLELFYTKENFISDLKVVASSCFIRICLAFSLWLGFESNVLINSKVQVVGENEQERNKKVLYFREILMEAMDDLCNYGYISL